MSATKGVSWRCLVDPPLSGAANMARDHALADSVGPGGGVVRFYRWVRPTVSFGRNEPAVDVYRTAELPPDWAVVRRPTGGRAVLHDQELTYAVAFPRGALGGMRSAYGLINRGLVDGLRSLGVAAEQTVDGTPLPPSSGPCFGAAAPGEIAVGGRKIVGSAQARIGQGVVQHGSLLLAGDQGRLSALAPDAPAQTSPFPVTLSDLLCEVPSWDALVDALVGGLASSLGRALVEGSLTADEVARANSLVHRYESKEWTWRR